MFTLGGELPLDAFGAKVGFGPFVLVDTKGGKEPFAARRTNW